MRKWQESFRRHKLIKTAAGRGFSLPKAMKQSVMAITNDKLRMVE